MRLPTGGLCAPDRVYISPDFPFLPGIIAHFTLDALTFHPKRETHQLVVRSFVLGVFSYVLLALANDALLGFSGVFGYVYEFQVQMFEAPVGDSLVLNYREIFWATFLAVPAAFLFARVLNNKYLNRLGKFLGVTQKIGDVHLWNYVLESPDTQWVVVRDIKYNLAYQGRIQGFSETFTENELILREIIVLQNDSGEVLYEVDGLYLARDPKDLTVEFVVEQGGESEDENAEEN